MIDRPAHLHRYVAGLDRTRRAAAGPLCWLLCGTLLATSNLVHAQDVDDDGDGGPAAQAQLSGPPQPSGPPTTLHGTVINAVTHQPIARALVSLEQHSQAVLTDNEGRFSFEGVPGGSQTILTARRPGYSSDDFGNVARQATLVGSGADVTIELVPQSAITGELILPSDDSPDQLQIQLLHQEIQSGRGHWSIYRNIEANSEGHFRFGNLPAGAYLVHVGASIDPVPAQQPAGAVQARTGYVPAFYPGVRDMAGAGLIELSAGQQADVKMELIREPFYPVAIPVANPDEARAVGFEVTSDSFLGYPARFSPSDGLVHVELPGGHYLLEARGFGQRAVSGQREFDVNAGATRTGAIALLPVSRIPVTVHREFAHLQVQAAGSDIQTAANQISLDLERQGGSQGGRGQRPSLQDDNGARVADVSHLVGAAPGKYWVNARAYNGYIASITSGGVDLLVSPLTVAADGSASPIDVTLRDDYASLSVTLGSSLLTAGTPLYVHLVPYAGAAFAASEMILPAQATMTINNVPPGGYLAFASSSRREAEYRNPAILSALAGSGQTVSVDAGGNVHITIDTPGNSLTDTAATAP